MPVGAYGGPTGGYSYGGGGDFFGWLFSGPQGRPYPPRAVPTTPRCNERGRFSSR